MSIFVRGCVYDEHLNSLKYRHGGAKEDYPDFRQGGAVGCRAMSLTQLPTGCGCSSC